MADHGAVADVQSVKTPQRQRRRPLGLLRGTEGNQEGVQGARSGGKFERPRSAPCMPDRFDFQLLSAGLRRMGWIRFWIQVVLGVVVLGVLLFTAIGGSLARNAERAVGLGPGISLTTLAFFVLLYSLWHGWLIVRNGRALNSAARPTRGETSRLIKRGLIADLLGLVLATVGYQALVGPLFIQASMQTQGLAVIGRGTADNLPITSLEILSVLSNTQVLFAHLIGLILSLWLLQRVYRTS